MKIAQQLLYFAIACVIAGVGFIIAGPPPLEIYTMEVVNGPIVSGHNYNFQTHSDKAWWAVRFCTATSSTIYMIDSQNVVRQSAIAGVNFNDGTYHGAKFEVMVTSGTEAGPMTAQLISVYECLGIARTVRGPLVKLDVKAGPPSVGAAGPAGATGATGPQGPAGPAGP